MITEKTGVRRAIAAIAVLFALAAGCAVPSAVPSAVPTTSTPPAAVTAAQAPAGFDAATRDDTEFNAQFRHEFADVDGVRMHYVTGGSGPPLVLLHGWPQSWFEWRAIMPDLAQRHTVYAVDLPGLGDSEGAPTGYDKATLARYVHGLIGEQLGLRDISLVAHDLGAGVGFAYAALFGDEVARYAHLDYPLPGPALTAAQYRTFSWHLAFHTQPEVPETVVDDDVRAYLALFYPQVAFGGSAFGGTRTESPFTDAEIDEYARTYVRPQVLHGGFELYRTLDVDERDNAAAAPITVPTLLLAAQGTLDGLLASVAPRMAAIERAVEVPGSGHWLVEENPQFVVDELLTFLAR